MINVCFYIISYFEGHFLPWSEVVGLLNQIQKDLLEKGNESKVVSEYFILAQKGAKIAARKKVYFLVFANHYTVHSWGVSRGRVRDCGC